MFTSPDISTKKSDQKKRGVNFKHSLSIKLDSNAWNTLKNQRLILPVDSGKFSCIISPNLIERKSRSQDQNLQKNMRKSH